MDDHVTLVDLQKLQRKLDQVEADLYRLRESHNLLYEDCEKRYQWAQGELRRLPSLSTVIYVEDRIQHAAEVLNPPGSLVPVSTAAKVLHVHPRTLKRWRTDQGRLSEDDLWQQPNGRWVMRVETLERLSRKQKGHGDSEWEILLSSMPPATAARHAEYAKVAAASTAWRGAPPPSPTTRRTRGADQGGSPIAKTDEKPHAEGGGNG